MRWPSTVTWRVVGVLALVSLAAGLSPERSHGLDAIECDGAMATNPDPESTRLEVGENKRFTPDLGIGCLPAGHTVSSSLVDWGDGTTSVPVITFTTNSDGTQQAWIGGDHSYPRATCPRAFCPSAFKVSATVTEDQTGQVFPLRAYIDVTPVIDVIALAPVRAQAHRIFRGRLATVHTGGLRFLHEMTARVSWDDGTSSRARVSGQGQDYEIAATHRWRVPGVYNVALVIRDGFTRERTLRYLRGHVAGAR